MPTLKSAQRSNSAIDLAGLNRVSRMAPSPVSWRSQSESRIAPWAFASETCAIAYRPAADLPPPFRLVQGSRPGDHAATDDALLLSQPGPRMNILLTNKARSRGFARRFAQPRLQPTLQNQLRRRSSHSSPDIGSEQNEACL